MAAAALASPYRRGASPAPETLFSTTAYEATRSSSGPTAVAASMALACTTLTTAAGWLFAAAVSLATFLGLAASIARRELRDRRDSRTVTIERAGMTDRLVVVGTDAVLRFPLSVAGARRVDGSRYEVHVEVTDADGRSVSFGASNLVVDGPDEDPFDDGVAVEPLLARFLLRDVSALADLRRAIDQASRS